MSLCRPISALSKNIYNSIRHAHTFKAVKLESLEGALKIEDVPRISRLKKGQVRIQVHNCAVNATDFLLAQGSNTGKYKLPIIPGYELSGTVTEVNSTTDLKVNDRVVALSKDTLGGFAEECIVDEKDVWAIPPNLPFDKAAAVADSFGTAMLGLVRRGHLNEKDIVLATIAPAHGYAAIDLAANVYKAKVIGVSLTEKDAVGLRDRGAWSSLAYNDDDLFKVVSDLTKKQGVKVIYDTMGGDVLKTCLKCVSHEGYIIIAGNTLNDLPPVKIHHLLSLPSFSMTNVSLASYRKHGFNIYRQTISDVLEMYEQGLISPMVTKSFPLTDVNLAISFIQEKKPIGKVILDIKI